MRRHPNDERNRAWRPAREDNEGGSEYYDREEEVGRPVTDNTAPSGWDQRGMSGYGGGGSFGGMGYSMGVGGHGTYVAGHRPSREWAPYREQAEQPRPQRAAPSESFRGRGPRGYRRSDDRIREDVCDRLTEDHDIDASDIDLKVEAGEVTLEGTVTERRLKWLAEEIASSCSGVVDVHNHLRVKRHEAQPTGEEAHRTAEAPPRNGGSAQRTSPSRNT